MSMTIRLFDVENGKVIPTEHCYTIAVLKEIMDKYPEEKYLKMYAYLQYMTCPNPDLNPYFNMPDDEKEQMIMDGIKADFSTEDEPLPQALEHLKKLNDTATWRAFRGMKSLMDKLGKYLEVTSISSGRDGNGMFLLKAGKEFPELRNAYKMAYRDLEEEQSGNTRGGVGKAYDEK